MTEFYRHWLKAEGPPPEAPGLFDCDNCFMVKPYGLTRDLGPFKPHLKCCTFQPFLPSFTLGHLIAESAIDPGILHRFFEKSRLSPLGAFPRSPGTSICETGKNDSDSCPFLSSEARCTIREFRPSTCAGYVCRSKDGANGFKKWAMWEERHKKFEWTLSHLAAFDLGRTMEDVDLEFSDRDSAKAFYIRACEAALSIKMDLPEILD